MIPQIKIKKLSHFCGTFPHYESHAASGADVRASNSESIVLKPGERAAVSTGMCLEIPDGFEIQVRPRSGLALKNGVTLVNAPGTIDSDYRGELKIIIINHGDSDFVINRGDRIAQLVVAPVLKAEFVESEHLTSTERGLGGFGSTGV